MNWKKTVSTLAVLFAVLLAASFTFAIPAPDDEDPLEQALAPYAAQFEQMSTILDNQLLPPVKAVAQLAKQVQEAQQEDLTPEQSQVLDQHLATIDTVLGQLVSSLLKDVKMADLLQQYEINATNNNLRVKQLIEQYGQEAVAKAGYQLLPEKITEEELLAGLKLKQLESGILYFAMMQKLDQQEIELVSAIFFSQEETTEQAPAQ